MAGAVQQNASAWLSDDGTRAMLFEGLTVNQLAVAFGMGPQVVHRRLAAVQPSGRRGRFALYKLADAAPYLVEPMGDIEEKIKRMNHRDLPPMLLKEFWSALRARQAFEQEEGDLWRTTDVVAAFAEAFKSVRMSLLLMGDTLEREAAFTELQREKLQALIDATLEECRARLIRTFADPSGAAATEAESPGGPNAFDPEDEFQGL